MGGYGSGRYMRLGVKNSRRVTQFQTLDIRQLRKERQLRPGEQARIEFEYSIRGGPPFVAVSAVVVWVPYHFGLRPFFECLVAGGAVACCTWRNAPLVGNAWGCPIRFNSRRNKTKVSDAPGKPERSWCNRTAIQVVAIGYPIAASPKVCTGPPSTGCGIARRKRRRNCGTARLGKGCWNSRNECGESWTRYWRG